MSNPIAPNIFVYFAKRRLLGRYPDGSFPPPRPVAFMEMPTQYSKYSAKFRQYFTYGPINPKKDEAVQALHALVLLKKIREQKGKDDPAYLLHKSAAWDKAFKVIEELGLNG